MKNIFYFFALLLFSISCKAQSPVLDISQDMGTENLTGAYYKDTYNLLNPFEGTYLYTNGNTIFKIVFQKKVMGTVHNLSLIHI